MKKIPSDALGRVQPQAVPLEEAVLGACLVDKEAFLIAGSILSASDFYVEDNQAVFASMQRLSSKNAPIDMLTVMEEIKTPKIASYLAELTNRVASAANVEYHARIIREKKLARDLITGASNVLKAAYEEVDPFDILTEHETFLASLMEEKHSGVSNSSEVADLTMKEIVDAYERKGTLKGDRLFGISGLDKMVDGVVPADFICIAGRPKMGKTAVAAAITMNTVECGGGLYYASSEMRKPELFLRTVSGLTKIPVSRIEKGLEIDNPEWQEEHSRTAGSKIHWYTGQMNVHILKSHIHLYMRLYGVTKFMIDRFELFDEIVNCRPGAENEARSKLAAALRVLANQTQASIIVFAQCNANSEKTANKRPTVADIYGGTALQANCTKLLLLYRPEVYGLNEFSIEHEGEDSKGKMEVYVAAGNSIGYGSVIVSFDGGCRVIRDLERFNPTLPQAKDLPF